MTIDKVSVKQNMQTYNDTEFIASNDIKTTIFPSVLTGMWKQP